MSHKDNVFYVRRFLNADEGIGCIEFAVERARDEYINTEFKIRDCYRHIELDFGLTKSTRAKTLKKLRCLIVELENFEAALQDEASKL